MGYPWISLYGITRYNSVYVGISSDTSALISGIASLRDIPVTVFFELMQAQNCLFWALKCSNYAHTAAQDKLMEALFFISAFGLA